MHPIAFERPFRALYVISYWHESFEGRPIGEIFAVWNGGIVYYGGLVGATLACAIYLRIKKLPLWKVADIIAPSIAFNRSPYSERIFAMCRS